MADKIKGLPEHICLCFKVYAVKFERKIADRKEHSDIMLWGRQILIGSEPLTGVRGTFAPNL